jgi:hypothetical protein
LGEGFVDLEAFFAALHEGGVDGYVAYEMCSQVRSGGSETKLDRTAAARLPADQLLDVAQPLASGPAARSGIRGRKGGITIVRMNFCKQGDRRDREQGPPDETVKSASPASSTPSTRSTWGIPEVVITNVMDRLVLTGNVTLPALFEGPFVNDLTRADVLRKRGVRVQEVHLRPILSMAAQTGQVRAWR